MNFSLLEVPVQSTSKVPKRLFHKLWFRSVTPMLMWTLTWQLWLSTVSTARLTACTQDTMSRNMFNLRNKLRLVLTSTLTGQSSCLRTKYPRPGLCRTPTANWFHATKTSVWPTQWFQESAPLRSATRVSSSTASCWRPSGPTPPTCQSKWLRCSKTAITAWTKMH